MGRHSVETQRGRHLEVGVREERQPLQHGERAQDERVVCGHVERVLVQHRAQTIRDGFEVELGHRCLWWWQRKCYRASRLMSFLQLQEPDYFALASFSSCRTISGWHHLLEAPLLEALSDGQQRSWAATILTQRVQNRNHMCSTKVHLQTLPTQPETHTRIQPKHTLNAARE